MKRIALLFLLFCNSIHGMISKSDADSKLAANDIFQAAYNRLNLLIEELQTVNNNSEIDDYLSTRVVNFIAGALNSSLSLNDEKNIIVAMFAMLYKKTELRKSIRNSVEVYLVSVSILLNCVFFIRSTPLLSYESLQKFVLLESNRYKAHYDRISHVLKKSFRLIKLANLISDNNVSFVEISENYEEYMEKLDGEILDLYWKDQVLNSLTIGAFFGIIGFILSCHVMDNGPLQKHLQFTGVLVAMSTSLAYAVLRGANL